ncbi:MAG: hypothetical protein AB1725_04040 [Armatimonadota bacterium]
MRVTLALLHETELFETERGKAAELEALRGGGSVYSWKTTGRANWLERGFSVVDVLGYVVLPSELPATIDMPDDTGEGD